LDRIASIYRRLEKIREKLGSLHLDAFVIADISNIRYLTGFSGSNAWCIATPDEAYFLTDFRYQLQSREEVQGWKIVIARKGLVEAAEEKNLLSGVKRIGFEAQYVTYEQFERFHRLFPRKEWKPFTEFVESIARVRDDVELGYLRKAVSITDRVFQDVLKLLKHGVVERDVSTEISYLCRRYGADAGNFDNIVASGVRSAMPHGTASSKRITKGELVIIDFGCTYNGYGSDMTRTVSVGAPSQEVKRIYQVVLDAQHKAIDAAKPGMNGKSLDAVARSFVRSKGYGRYFGHGLGHGLGLGSHGTPLISTRGKKYILETGNVITIEPGIYLPNKFGIRIEDDVVITDEGCEVLTRSPKELIVL
jgi:Xaa-Pro aminopeptidase